MERDFFVHATAEVPSEPCIGAGTRIWHQAQVMTGASIGADCTLGKGVFVGTGSSIGRLVKLGNYANVFGATLEDEVFVGPNACLLEDPHPRATTPDGVRKGPGDFVARPVTVRHGATIGAAAVLLPGVTIGRFALIAAGAVVHRDVPHHALVVGNPARQVGYVCRCGQRLNEDLDCACGRHYHLDQEGALIAAEHDQ